jgi:pimeloyl-ACP methyl ester carboxylesterase
MYSIREMIIEGHTIVAHSFNSNLKGVPAVLLHGDSTSLNVWTLSPPEIIQDRFRWHALSLPGHYPARFPEGFRKQDLTAGMIARILAEAIRQLEPGQRVILIGHSTGGFVALTLAARSPEIVHSVISISGFVRGKCSGLFGALQWLASHGKATETLAKIDYKILASSRFMFRAGLSVYAYDRKNLYSFPVLEKIIDLVYPDSKNLDLDSMMFYLNQMSKFDIRDQLPNIHVPTLAMAGKQDPVVPPTQSRIIAEKVPHCELILLDGVGHLPMAERPMQYNHAITGWLEKVM